MCQALVFLLTLTVVYENETHKLRAKRVKAVENLYSVLSTQPGCTSVINPPACNKYISLLISSRFAGFQ